MNIKNIILNTDSYKPSHWLQYKEGIEYVHSYGEARGGKYKESVMFGLQIALNEYFTKPFTMQDIEEADEFLKEHGVPFNREGWISMLNKYDGSLPIRIRAVPEGLVVPIRNVLFTVENTDPEFAWVVSYVETAILRAVWYGTTVATNSWNIKKLILKYLEETGTPEGVGFKLHDFGARGVSSFESSGIGGAAHLINFMGSDNITGALFAKKYYNATEMPAFSIPAAEHSTMTSWGGRDGEQAAMENMLQKFGKPGALLAVVSDSYDIYHAVKELWGNKLKQKVLDSGATVVVRPDSGHPATVVLKVVQLLAESYGTYTNEKGYLVLNPAVRVIQGDGINQESIEEILSTLKENGFSADNVAFGMGGALIQQVNRDTMQFAMKASAARIAGEWIDVFKDPITDTGKLSKKGRLDLYRDEAGYFTSLAGEGYDSVLETVYNNGKITKKYTFEEIRENTMK